jgi:hypothetical protein
MSTKSQVLVGSDYKLPLLEQAVCIYNSQGEDFYNLLFEYLQTEGKQNYIFTGPDYILIGGVEEDDEGKYWHVAYAAHSNPKKTLQLFFELAPFRLDRVRFSRYHNMDKLKTYSWDDILRISNYGKKT